MQDIDAKYISYLSEPNLSNNILIDASDQDLYFLPINPSNEHPTQLHLSPDKYIIKGYGCIVSNNDQNCTVCNDKNQSSTQDNLGYTIGSLFSTFTRLDFLFVYGVILIVSILFLLSFFFGTNTTFYQNLIKQNIISGWVIEVLWVIATILSYIGLFFLWDNKTPNQDIRNLRISVLFLIGNFLTLAWSVTFFQAENITFAAWIAAAVLIYNFWLFIYLYYINVIASLFLIPIILMYVYLLYFTIHIAFLNNIPI